MASITHHGPTRNVSSLQDEVERAFRQAFGSGSQGAASPAGAFSPALDVEEDENGFILHIELPSVSADDVEVSLEENVLTVAGERPFYADKSTDSFRRLERQFGRFHRAVRLPDRVNGERVEATYRDGLLTISVPKAEDAKPRRIPITSA